MPRHKIEILTRKENEKLRILNAIDTSRTQRFTHVLLENVLHLDVVTLSRQERRKR